MVENQPYNPGIIDVTDSTETSNLETWNKEINDLRKLIEGKDLAEINAKLDESFLVNLEKWLHPDTAKNLKIAIEHVEWYNQEGTQLNKLYNYVISVCDAFDTQDNKDNDHETIRTKFDIGEFLDDGLKKNYERMSSELEYINIIIKDDKISWILSAIKGIIHWNTLSWGTIVKMAEFLWINTRESDDKYNVQNRLNRLWKKVFSVDNSKWLYRWLINTYNEMSNNDKIKEFKEKPFETVSLIDMSKLLKIEWSWELIQEDNEQIIKFCTTNWFDVKQFVTEFNETNQKRIDSNKEWLKQFNLMSVFTEDELSKFSVTNVSEEGSSLTQVQLKYWDVQLLADGSNLISALWLENKVKDQLKKVKLQTNFINEAEFTNLINSDPTISKERFDKILAEIEQRQQTTPSEVSIDTPETQSEELRELDPEEIKNLRDWLNKKTVADFFNNVIKIENITEEQKSLLLLTQKWLTTEEWRINDVVKELQIQLWFTWSAIDWQFGKNTFKRLKKKFLTQIENPVWNTPTENPGWNNSTGNPENPTPSGGLQDIPDVIIDSVDKVFSDINKQEIVDFFKVVKMKQNLTNQQKTLIQLAHIGLTTPREENPDNAAYQAVSQLQSQLKTKVDWKFGRNTFNKLKQKFWMYVPNQENPVNRQQRPNAWPRESMEGTFNFNADNYKYYVEYHNANNQDICATYAYWVASDILASKWCCFPTTAVSSWNIKGQRDIQDKFKINTLSDNNPKQQITSAPAWTFLTLKYDRTSHQDKGVSHVMVSLGNGVYTDLFGSKIRKIDFKSAVSFSWKKISIGGSSYTLSEDSRLISPKLWSFIEWSKETINKQNVTPEQFANEIRESTWADINYIKSLIAKDNNLSLADFNTKKSNLSVKIIQKEIRDLGVDNAEWSNNVAKNFLNWIKEKKNDIMWHYHNLTNREYDEIARRAMWILYQESDSGRSAKYRWYEAAHGVADRYRVAWVGRAVYWAIRWKEFSRWYTRIKFNDNFNASDKTFLKTLGINSERDLTDGKKCGIATMVALINKYNQYVKPMKTDPFWTNDAIITKITFNDNTSEEIAKKKAVPMNGTRRVRTSAEIDSLVSKWANKHGWIKEQTNTRRPGIKQEKTFFDYLYYSRNKPSEIVYWTASLSDNSVNNDYIAQCNQYMDSYTQMT